MITWVLVVFLCSGMSDNGANCEERVVEHGMTEEECHRLALGLSAHHARPTVECIREDNDSLEDHEMEADRPPDPKRKAGDI